VNLDLTREELFMAAFAIGQASDGGITYQDILNMTLIEFEMCCKETKRILTPKQNTEDKNNG
jgi:hypothetical protein